MTVKISRAPSITQYTICYTSRFCDELISVSSRSCVSPKYILIRKFRILSHTPHLLHSYTACIKILFFLPEDLNYKCSQVLQGLRIGPTKSSPVYKDKRRIKASAFTAKKSPFVVTAHFDRYYSPFSLRQNRNPTPRQR